MPGAKRRRSAPKNANSLTEDDVTNTSDREIGSDIGDVGRVSPQKRARTSDAQAMNSSTAKRDGEREEAMGEDEEEEEDGEEGELIDEKENAAFLFQSQKLQNDVYEERKNEPAAYGIILSVTLENFMCHRALEMRFGPFMNFVVGQNGSGKSAVLTALTLCLGGKASTTSRGTNIRNFIKEKEHTATIEVKIKNGGDGHKTDIYGDVITVVRTFNRDGGGGYKIKAKNGKTISTKKEELEEISDYMGLQIDNPMTVLSQDMARQFLSNSTPQEKYKFFMKGINLDQLRGDYDLLKKSQQTIHVTLRSKNEDIKELRDDMEVAKKRFELIAQTNDLRKEVERCLDKHAWAQVEERERDARSYENSIAEIETRRARLEQELEQSSLTLDTSTKNVEDAKTAHEQAFEAIQPLKENKTELKAQFDGNRSSLTSQQQDERELHQQIQDAKNKIKRYRTQIDTENDRLRQLDGGQHAELLQTKEDKVVEVSRLKQEAQDLEATYESGLSEQQKCRSDAQRSQEVVEQKKEEIKQAEIMKRNIESSRSQELAGFGREMPALLEAIRRTNWKSGTPIGPIGRYIKLRDPKWASVLERQLGNTLNAFVCQSSADIKILRSLMERHLCKSTIFESPAGEELSLVEPPEDCLTVLRALEIENTSIKRALVISHVIDQTILIEDHNQAIGIMRNPPPNTKFCYALQPRRGWGFNVKGGSGVGGLTPIPPFNGLPRITTNSEIQINNIRETISSLTRELQDLYRIAQETQTLADTIDSGVNAYHINKSDNTRNIQRLEYDLEQIQLRLENSGKQDGALASLEGSLKVAEESKAVYESQYTDFIASKDRLSDEQRRLGDAIRQVTEQITQAEQTANDLDQVWQRAVQSREQSLTSKDHWHAKLTDNEESLKDAQTRLEVIKGSVRDMVEKAGRISERIPLTVDETVPFLTKKLEALNTSIKNADKSLGGSAEQIAKDYTDKAERFKTAEREVASLNALKDLVKKTWHDRMTKWTYFRQHISGRARAQFQYFMSERDYSGVLRFHHTSGELQLGVQPSQAAGSQRGAKTLSGGEKSFSQICLLLALWEAMGSPIRCLDEFDVFMDAVNRGISMQLIIKAAQKSVGKQFILITPQDVSTKSIDSRNDVRIVRMPDPERNKDQSTLSFAPIR